LLYLVACTAKQNAFLVPLLWLAYEYRFVASEKRVLAITSPRNSLIILFCTGCIAYLWKSISMGGLGALQLHAWKVISRMDLYPKPDFIDYVHLLLKSWGTMLAKTVWPLNLGPEYSIQAPATWLDFAVLLAILTTASAVIALCRSSRSQASNVFFALLWCLTFWLPVSNLWPAAALAADRYWYAILPGLIYLFLQATSTLFENHRKTTAATITCVCLVFAALSFQQSQHWQNNALLWQRAVTVSPESSVANHNMGVTLYLNGEVDPALEYLHKSLSLYPYKKIGYYNLSQIYTKLGRHSEALDAKHKMRLRPPWERQ
jgi:tetratricopeptide (TPR) repeat protein